MLRKQRDYLDYGGVYHIYNRTAKGRSLFSSESDYVSFLERYRKYFHRYFVTFAYCLVPNHFHFLVRVKEPDEIDVSTEKTIAARKYLSGECNINFFLEHQLARMFSGIAIKKNNVENKKGPLFDEATKRVLLKTEGRLVYQLCYIHHNVIHHHLGKHYKDWKYSSYLAYLNGKSSWLSTHIILEMLGGVDVFIDLHNNFKLERKEMLSWE